jgi:hypothetical protein
VRPEEQPEPRREGDDGTTLAASITALAIHGFIAR